MEAKPKEQNPLVRERKGLENKREENWRTRGKREAGLCQEEEYSSNVKGVKEEKGVNEDAEGILVWPFSRY